MTLSKEDLETIKELIKEELNNRLEYKMPTEHYKQKVIGKEKDGTLILGKKTPLEQA